MWVGAGVLIALAAALVAFAFGTQRRILFPAPAAVPGAEPPRYVERLWLDSEAGRTEAWLLAREGDPGPSPLLLFAHGNGELIDDWAETFRTPLAWGVHVLLVEYPGYGRSRGRPSERTIAHVMRAAYDRAVARPEVDAARVIGYGRSLGGGAVCALARERVLAALVLESSFTSVGALAARMGWPRALVLDPLDNEAVLRGFERPVLILHGRHDPIIPPENAPSLARAAPRGELVWLDCGHNDCPRPWSAIRRFLDAHGLAPSDRAPGLCSR
jgi:hypothetical protein